MTVPLTLTLPEAISSSACRREAMPAEEVSFCNRCFIECGGGRGHYSIRISGGDHPQTCRNHLIAFAYADVLTLFGTTCEILKVFDAGQFGKILQAKLNQEFL